MLEFFFDIKILISRQLKQIIRSKSQIIAVINLKKKKSSDQNK